MQNPTCQRDLCWGWLLLLLRSPEAEPHELSAMALGCKCPVKGVHRVFQVVHDPMASSFYHKKWIPMDNLLKGWTGTLMVRG